MNGELNACFLSKIWCCRHFNGEKFLVLFPPRLDWSARLRERSESPDFSKVATTPNQFCGTQRAAAPKLLNLGTAADHVWGRTNRLIGAGHKTARIDLFPFCRWLLLSKTRDGAPKEPPVGISLLSIWTSEFFWFAATFIVWETYGGGLIWISCICSKLFALGSQ